MTLFSELRGTRSSTWMDYRT